MLTLRPLIWPLVFMAFALPAGAASVIELTEHTNLRGAWLLEQPDAVEIDVRVIIEAGEYDNTGPEGLAHYLEHLVFWSAHNTHNAFADRTTNAWTSRNWTLYWNNGPRANVAAMLDAATRVFEPVRLDAAFAQSEVDIVEREYDLRASEAASFRLYTKMYQTMYAGHPFARSVIGSRESIRSLKPESTVEFHRNWYRAGNAYLLVAGPIRAAELIPLLAQRFGRIADGDIAEHSWERESRRPDSIDINMTHPTLREPRIIYMRHADARRDANTRRRFATCALINELLNSAQPGGLAKPLYYDDFLTLSVQSYCDVQPDRSSLLSVWAQPGDGIDADDLFTAIERTLPRLAREPAFESSIETIKQRLVKTLTRESRRAPLQIDMATLGLIAHGQILTHKNYIDDITSTATTDVKRLLEEFAQSATIARGQIQPEN